MPTGTVVLPTGAALPPDNSAGNEPAGIVVAKSSAAAPTPHFLQLLFDAAVDEMVSWSFRMPQDYASAPSLKVQYKMASATSGNVIIACDIMAVSDGDSQDVDADAFGTINTSAATTVPATAGYLDEISLTLTNNDSLVAGDFVLVHLSRDANNAGDTAAGDMEVVAVSLEYTTS
jgi:hypothetical protein